MFLFDADAISESFRARPLPRYLAWLENIPAEEQFTSAIVVGELYRGAFRSQARDRHLANIENRVLPEMTILPFDEDVARVFGELAAALELAGKILATADLQIAATAVHHGLDLVTGNIRHFDRVPDLRINLILADARTEGA